MPSTTSAELKPVRVTSRTTRQPWGRERSCHAQVPRSLPVEHPSPRADGRGPAIVDFGAPLDGTGDVTGFSILEADSRSAMDGLLADHPHRHAPGAEIDVYEFMAIPGM